MPLIPSLSHALRTPASGMTLLLALVPAAAVGQARVSSDPDSARLITSDVALFWAVVDQSPPDSLAVHLQRDYLDKGTAGVRDFIPGRIRSADALAEMVRTRRDRYESRRTVSLAAASAEPRIREAFHTLKALYPDAVFPDVFFVIGRFNSGGTVSPRGLLIGAEMQTETADFTRIVAHELIHFQQRSIAAPSRTLLAQSLMEGSADFVAELIAGEHINQRAHEYGMAHEAALWPEFRAQMNGRDMNGWLYGGQPEGRPADLGYFFGYRIAQSYYDRSADKAQALRDILTQTDAAVFLERSGYDPGGTPDSS